VAKVTIARRTKLRPLFFTLKTAALYLCAVIPLLHLCHTRSLAQEFHPTESQVEAAYLYNFGKFVTWPADRNENSTTFQICALGKDPFGGALDAIVRGENIGGKKIEVLRLTTVQQGQSCKILFVTSSEESHLQAILVAAQTFNWLTVSTMTHFVDRGGVIEFVQEGDRVRFEVNRAAAERDHLILSSDLLKVAVKVIQKR